jgi:hypothetical protein
MQVICMRDLLNEKTPSVQEIEGKLATALASHLHVTISDNIATSDTLPY